MKDNDYLRNIMILGSSSAYSGYADSSVYCAAKHGLVGYIRSLNDEYSHSNIRFILFSTGTIDNEMGKKVKTNGKLLKPDEIATLIYENLIETSTSFQPEIIIRRRNIL
jgi:NAD(P)-dependent dehydrogenase (short-subunit alcohol dehydrogenase family)